MAAKLLASGVVAVAIGAAAVGMMPVAMASPGQTGGQQPVTRTYAQHPTPGLGDSDVARNDTTAEGSSFDWDTVSTGRVEAGEFESEDYQKRVEGGITFARHPELTASEDEPEGSGLDSSQSNESKGGSGS